ncbi:hypothetical protein HPB47_017784 [Ixodes persulcatus]|uniref:Uncharacterized protein n=1 Tax=Ixodes persulcatus TaxID=34615 RepID=A0AC60QPP7_IXOPE|nr:hypothetical protein HPB47_017784 [Ixodes persulcatus]
MENPSARVPHPSFTTRTNGCSTDSNGRSRNAPTFDSNCKLGRHSRHQIQKQHPHLSCARWRHDPNLLHLREREALRPRPFNKKFTKLLPKCCRTQRGSPVSPHNSTASGRHRLTRTNTTRKSKAYIVWQSNCRGYGKKSGHFQQHINALTAEDQPDVIALQEPRRLDKLSGYVTFGCDNSKKTQVTTLVKRNVPVILHDTGISTIDHLLIEIIAPKKADTRSLFVLNIYSCPRSKHTFAKFFHAALEIARKQPLLVVGDFNAPHPAWGYRTKSRQHWTDTHESGISLITHPDQPTRHGDIRQNDTTPDLAFPKHVKDVIWSDTGEDLGSDHFVVPIDATAGPTQRRGKPCTVIEWDKYRSLLEEQHVDDIRDIDLWSDWIRTTTDHATKDTLQAAIDAVEDYVTPRGLACSPQKSELLLLKPMRAKQLPSDIELYTRGVRIPTVKSIRVLGLRIQADGNNYETINLLKAATYQITRLISRISGRRFGMRELAEKAKLDCLIRKSYKRALGLPDSNSNDRFVALGLHNTVKKIMEAQRLSQMERLTRSATGRHILRSLGIRYDSQTGPKCTVPTQVRTVLLIQPIPEHMHPIHHEGRRSARVRALRSVLSKERDAYYVDAADYGTGKMVSAVIDAGGSLVAGCSIDTTNPGTVKEVAIALALQTYKARFIFAKGRVSPQAARILRGFAPATAARGLIGLAGLTLDPSTTSLAGRDGLAGDRARYPPAHAALDKASTVAWRRLQTNSYPNPFTLHKWYPDSYSPKCKLCGAKANLRHMLWECARVDRSKYPKISAVTSQDDWDALLKASSQEVQEAVVR